VYTTLSDLDTVFDAFFGRPALARRIVRPINREATALHLAEEEHAYVLTAALPGVRAEDVSLDVTREGFRLAAERNPAVPDGFEPVRRERRAWRLSRAWSAPMPLDPDAAEARLENGVLTVRLPKATAARPRRLEIR
jgi:HSP20 family protein